MSKVKSLTNWSVEPTNVNGHELAICLTGESDEMNGRKIRTAPVEMVKNGNVLVFRTSADTIFILNSQDMNIEKANLTQYGIDILEQKHGKQDYVDRNLSADAKAVLGNWHVEKALNGTIALCGTVEQSNGGLPEKSQIMTSAITDITCGANGNLRFRTGSGSVYEADTDKMNYHEISRTLNLIKSAPAPQIARNQR